MYSRIPRSLRLVAAVAALVTVAASCGDDNAAGARTTSPAPAAVATTPLPVSTTAPAAATTAPAPASSAPAATQPASNEVLRIGAIPDQDPEKLTRLYGLVADYLGKDLGVKVEYVPVTDYASAVSLFRAGDLDLVWFGGLTGVQATLQTPGAVVLAQRDIDADFHSVFIANADAGIAPVTDVAGLKAFAGKRFTFGSESSTSGRLMPEYFLDQAGVAPTNFDGEAGFSGSHDKTIDLVAAGTYQAGALNEQVWRKRIKAGTVDITKVIEVFVSPGYHDYHWIMNPEVPKRLGAEIGTKITAALTGLKIDVPDNAAILDLFGAKAFIPASAGDYGQIEEIGRKLGLITE
jgi:phosphonate transport system substrate-binding protein